MTTLIPAAPSRREVLVAVHWGLLQSAARTWATVAHRARSVTSLEERVLHKILIIRYILYKSIKINKIQINQLQ